MAALQPGDQIELFQQEPRGVIKAGHKLAISVAMTAKGGVVDRRDAKFLQLRLGELFSTQEALFGNFPKNRAVGGRTFIDVQAVGLIADDWGSVEQLRDRVLGVMLDAHEFELDYATWTTERPAIGDLGVAPRKVTLAEDFGQVTPNGVLDVLPAATKEASQDAALMVGSFTGSVAEVVASGVGGAAGGASGGVLKGLGVKGTLSIMVIVIIIIVGVIAFYAFQARAVGAAAGAGQ